jgi:hypothetical protein
VLFNYATLFALFIRGKGVHIHSLNTIGRVENNGNFEAKASFLAFF